ncbi:MAG: 4Fe-4S binding protein, partial [Planctomycetia bacterium]
MKLTRFLSQAFFLTLTVVGTFVLLANCEKWCPFGGVESLYTYLTEGNMTCSLGVSSFFILGATLLGVVLTRRAFCGYACPIGTVSSWTRSIAGRLGLKPIRVSRGWDRVLSLLKYPILGLILWFTWSAGELIFRAYCPAYALVGRHGEDITYWAYLVAGGIVVFSIFLTLPFCRWLCPLAAVLNPFSRLGLLRVHRDTTTCVECGACAKACPMAIPVDQMTQVNSARCITCFDCVASCPKSSDSLGWGPGSSTRWPRWTAVGLLLGTIALAVLLWQVAPLPSFVKEREGFTPPKNT